MIGSLKPYPEYKDSGVPWLDRVPAHWDVLPGYSAFVPKLVKNTGMIETSVLSLSYGQVVVKPSDKLHGLVPESFETYQIVSPGDIIIRPTDLQNDQVSLRVGRVRHRGIITSAYMCFRVNCLLSEEYGYLLLNAYDLLKVFYGYGSGLRQNLDFGHIKRMPLILPPRAEQDAIVCFLDHVDRRMRRYVAAKRKLIALLNEQKQAIINHAVTRGLYPNVRLKPSGVEWLGDVPEHWDVVPLKRLLSRMDYGTSESLKGHGKVRVLTMGHIRDGEIILPEHGGLDEVPECLLLERYDLLFNRTNSPELVGKVGIFRGDLGDEVSFASYLVRLRVSTRHNPFWINYLLNSTRFWAFARSQALVSLHQANLNSTRYGQLLIPVPPLHQQQEIAARVEEEVALLRRGVVAAEDEIALVREYHTRLIADVVTGKLDVREAAANFPEEVEEVLEGAREEAVEDKGEEDLDEEVALEEVEA